MTRNNSNSGTYYDEVFRRIQEMERKQFEEENSQNWNNYLKNYKPSDDSFNMFASYGYEISEKTIKA